MFSRDYYRLRHVAKTCRKLEALARSESVDGGSSFTSAGQGCSGRISRQIFRIQERAAYKLVNDRFKDFVHGC